MLWNEVGLKRIYSCFKTQKHYVLQNASVRWVGAITFMNLLLKPRGAKAPPFRPLPQKKKSKVKERKGQQNLSNVF